MTPVVPSIVEHVERLFSSHGEAVAHAESPLTWRQHALGCARLADDALAPLPLVAAALLHDIGQLLVPGRPLPGQPGGGPEQLAASWLGHWFDRAVTMPLRLQPQAARWLARTDARYAEALSPAALRLLMLRGGPLDDAETSRFEAQPHAMEAVRLQRWDLQARAPGRRAPPLSYCLALLDQLARPAQAAQGSAPGARDAA